MLLIYLVEYFDQMYSFEGMEWMENVNREPGFDCLEWPCALKYMLILKKKIEMDHVKVNFIF